MRQIPCLVALLVLQGCVNASPVMFAVSTVDKPTINKPETVELGGTILERGKYRLADALTTPNDIVCESGLLRLRITMPAGLLVARQHDAKFTYYYSSRTTEHDQLAGEIVVPNAAAVAVSNGNASDIKAVMMPTGQACDLLTRPQLQPAQVPFLDLNSFRKELVYGGRTGDTLKFQYREIFGDSTHPGASQDFEWNLKDGTTVSFKGARIEVFDGTNAKLSYQVLSSFPDEAGEQ